ncbi:MAG: hypothetical protein OEM60_10110 [Gammaproteobacteria bacterium]|nr:hypothetical protein [Gammaproteobacteria bacterium]
MNRNILFVFALSWVLVGCAAQSGDPQACEPQPKRVCKGDPQTPTIKLNTKNGKLKATPYCTKANPGTVLVFRLTPPGYKAKNVVEISPKESANAWLAGKNDVFQDLILIEVPADLDPDSYHYGIKTDTDCVDPRIDVTY